MWTTKETKREYRGVTIWKFEHFPRNTENK